MLPIWLSKYEQYSINFLQVPAQRYGFMKSSCPILGMNHKCPKSQKVWIHGGTLRPLADGWWLYAGDAILMNRNWGIPGKVSSICKGNTEEESPVSWLAKHCLQIVYSPAKTRKGRLLTSRQWHVSIQVLCTTVWPDEPWLCNFKIWDKNSSYLLSNSC